MTVACDAVFAKLSAMSFDDVIARRGSGSIKWDQKPNLDPFWVADMDFASPPEVLEALQNRVAHGVLGYAHPHDGLNEAVLTYLEQRHGAKEQLDSIVHLGGLVPALSLAARAFGEPGDQVMTGTPVYPPFLGVSRDNEMETIKVPHVLFDDYRYTFDWKAMENSVSEKTRIFLLCNPQNPLGRCFTEDEIRQVSEFCLQYGLILVSDEIHCDLVLDEKATPFFSCLNLPDEHRENLIVLQSPSKTYNIAGMGYAYAVIPNRQLRRKFTNAKGHTSPEINCLAYYSAEAAYRYGEPWRQELLAYLTKNRDTIVQMVSEELPEVKMPTMEATYLAWMDCKPFGYANPAVHLEKKENLFVSDGAYFDSPQHIRFNFGCAHSRVLEGMEKVVRGLKTAE
ncbi:MAG: PatB family C-S lyase [Verrucomicrobiota bacterium]